MALIKHYIRIILFITTLLVINCSIPYKEEWFDQEIDHFNFYTKPYGKDTYKQRYLVQDKWWDKQNGPLFFYAGNESPIPIFWNNTGFMFDIAPQFKALIVFAEHRFYGESLPFGSTKSFKHPYVDLLTVEQAMADFARLINHLKEKYKTDFPVVVFGGSYGGMLSAWMRIKYPNLVDGAIAASAPVNLITRAVDRDFFFHDVTKDFHDAVPGCDDKVRQAFALMKNLIATKEGLDKISSDFKLCEHLKDFEEYRSQLVGWIRNSFTNLAMFDYPYSSQFATALPPNPVKVACEKLVNAVDPIKGLAEAAGLYYGEPSCYDLWSEYVQCADPTGCGTGPESYAWDYQACTEMIMPSGTNNKTDMFPELSFTVEERTAYCKKRWNVEPRLDWMGINFWGKAISESSNIVFSNGNLDPWHRGGVLNSSSESVSVILIEGGAHHLDLRGSNPLDPASVKSARNEEITQIHKWIINSRRDKRRKWEKLSKE